MHRGQQQKCSCSARSSPTSTPPAARAPGSHRSRPEASTRDREELRRSVRPGGAAKRTGGPAGAAAPAVDAVAAVSAVAVCRLEEEFVIRGCGCGFEGTGAGGAAVATVGGE